MATNSYPHEPLFDLWPNIPPTSMHTPNTPFFSARTSSSIVSAHCCVYPTVEAQTTVWPGPLRRSSNTGCVYHVRFLCKIQTSIQLIPLFNFISPPVARISSVTICRPCWLSDGWERRMNAKVNRYIRDANYAWCAESRGGDKHENPWRRTEEQSETIRTKKAPTLHSRIVD